MAAAIGTETGATIALPEGPSRASLLSLRSIVLPVGLALIALAAWQAVAATSSRREKADLIAFMESLDDDGDEGPAYQPIGPEPPRP